MKPTTIETLIQDQLTKIKKYNHEQNIHNSNIVCDNNISIVARCRQVVK